MSDKWTSEKLIELLRGRFTSPAYAVLEQMADGTGFGAGSWIDAAVFSLWPSNGLYRAAYEVKVSRSDFLRELKKPSKNEWARQCFHQFWFLAPKNVIQVEELPEGAGWIAPNGSGLRIIRHASHRESPDLDDMLVSAMARAVEKEVEQAKKLVWREFWQTDQTAKRARVALDAVEMYLRSADSRGYHIRIETDRDDAAQVLLDRLRDASEDRGNIAVREEVMNGLESWRWRLLDLFDATCVTTFLSLAEIDEAGAIAHKLGSDRNKEAISELRAYVSGKRPNKRSFKRREWDQKKRIVDVFDFVSARAAKLLRGDQ